MPKDPTTKSDSQMQVAVLSETGRRSENQDWMSWSRIPWGECYIVADGMGGYKGGALAARMTVEGLERCLKAQSADRPFEQALQEAVSKTNEEVYRTAQSGNPETDHMGSTLAVALVSGNQLRVGHVGDSRIYLVRRRKLKLLTTDHTSVQRMVDSGMITEEQARVHPEAHILSRAIGSKPEVEIEIGKPVPLESGDGILLCSDGLSGYVKDQQIENVVNSASDVQRIPKQLVDLALELGGDDNITIQFVRYGKPSGQRARHTAIQDRFDLRRGGRRVRWLTAAMLLLVVVGLAFGVRRVMESWNGGTQTTVADQTEPGANPAPPSHGGAPAQPGQPQSPSAPGTQSGSAATPAAQPSATRDTSLRQPQSKIGPGAQSASAATPAAQPSATRDTSLRQPQSKIGPGAQSASAATPAAQPSATRDTSPKSGTGAAVSTPPPAYTAPASTPVNSSGAPAPAVAGPATAAASSSTPGPPPVFIFLRTNAEAQQADIIQSKLKPPPTVLSPRSDTDLDRPSGEDKPLDKCFIFYPDASLANNATKLRRSLDGIQATTSLCPDHKWHFGTYKDGGRTTLQEFVEGSAPQEHLLIAFPKKKE
jgi:protein phosphatase